MTTTNGKSQELSSFWKGKPKTEIQKYRMSMAKLGVLKTDQHKQNMSVAQKKQVHECKMLQMVHCIDYYTARKLRKQLMEEGAAIPEYADAELHTARINHVRVSNKVSFQTAYRSVMGCNKPTS